MERRLAAILFADVVGYSRLMERDEAQTLALLQVLHHDITEPLAATYNGKIIKFMGDGVMIEFASAVNAVECAVDMQRRACETSAAARPENRLVLRIGINLGDVMAANGDIYGDGVNIAARLEHLAEPGGILLSEDAYRHVHNRLKIDLEDIGPQALKNLAEPVRAYRVAGLAAEPSEAARHSGATGGARRPVMLVLPFINLSGDGEQEYFCHGLTNDITTELSKFSSLSVVSSTTAFAYKNRPLRVQEASRELGARYVLEGSIQKTPTRVRLNVQLIEASSDRHLWAQRFDRSAEDLFSLQDEVIEHIVAAMALKVEATERALAMRRPTDNLDAYDSYMRGGYMWLLHSLADETRQTLSEARRWLEAARALDPGYARSWAWLSLTYVQEWRQSWAGRTAMETAGKFARQALKIDPDDYQIRWILAYYLLNSRQFDLALSEYETAMSLNRNEANLLAEYAEALVYVGEHGRGLDATQQAIRMNPHSSEWYRADVAWELYLMRDYEHALSELSRIANPNADAGLILAACHGQIACLHDVEHDDNAAATSRQAAKVALRQTRGPRPQWTIAKERQKSPFKKETDLEHWLDGLRKAGLPE